MRILLPQVYKNICCLLVLTFLVQLLLESTFKRESWVFRCEGQGETADLPISRNSLKRLKASVLARW